MTTSTAGLIEYAGLVAGAYGINPPVNLSSGPSGVYLGNESGSSIDFHDYRSYQPGDDLRRVDWRVFARSDNLVIRRFRTEISPVVEVLLDTSTGMGFYAGKAAAAVYAAAFVAAVTRNSRGRPALLYDGKRFTGNDFEEGLKTAWVKPGVANPVKPGPVSPIEQNVPPPCSGHPMRIVISDFLFSSGLEGFARAAGRNTSLLIFLRLLSGSEREPELRGGYRFIDANNSRFRKNLRVNRYSIEKYKERLKTHLENLQETCRILRTVNVGLDVPDAFQGIEKVHESVVAALVRKEIIKAS
ncbi:MAG: DUF58 domain-containing protein [bacterium]|nr:DUF58 domain-containing protein [bacterium]